MAANSSWELQGGAEDVGVVLGEGADAGEADQFARFLEAVEGGELGVADGELAVAVEGGVVEGHVGGAVHGLEEDLVLAVGHGGEHEVAVMIEVAGALVEPALGEVAGPDVLVAAGDLEAAEEVLHGVTDGLALGEEEGEAGADVVGEGEEAELASQATVVAAGGLLQALEVGVELLGRGEEGAVDALQLGAGFVAAPVGAGQGGEFEGADLVGGGDVAAAAEVGEVGVGAEADGVVLGAELVDQLELEGLVVEVLAGVVEGDLLPAEGVVALDLGVHAALDLGEVVGGEAAGEEEVVVEAGVDGGADGDLGVGEELQDDLGKDVGGGVAHAAQPVGGVHLLPAGDGAGGAGLDVFRVGVLGHRASPVGARGGAARFPTVRSSTIALFGAGARYLGQGRAIWGQGPLY